MSSKSDFWRQAILPEVATISEAIINLNKTALKIVLVADKNEILLGTISDGDIRRGLLKGLNINAPITSVVNRNAFVVPSEISQTLVADLMLANGIQQIPIVDVQRRIIGLHLWNEINAPIYRSNLMVIMAGGMGKRLLPYTENCPKPMLLLHGKPMLQHIIERAKGEGFHNFIISIFYLGHTIEEYFGDGERLGVKIEYLREKFPLGTAGALSLLSPRPFEPFVITNGDVISDIRYGELLNFHTNHDATATMAVSLHEFQNQFGVVQTQGVDIIGFEEKPIIRSHINAGVYVLDPLALDELINGDHCDMPTLFSRLKGKGFRTVAYPMHEPWLDVGRIEDLKRASIEVIQN